MRRFPAGHGAFSCRCLQSTKQQRGHGWLVCPTAQTSWVRSCSSSSSTVPPSSSAHTRQELIRRIQANPALAAKMVDSLDAVTLARIGNETGSATAEKVKDTSVPQPSAGQLWRHAVRQSVPFVGFGFFDNLVMLTVGDAIDSTFGVALGFSTLAAAGFGQMVSDSVGIALQGIIERCADRLGLPDPKLTLEQKELGLVKTVTQISRVIGIVFGCFLGLCPLLFLDTNRSRIVDKILLKLPANKRSEFWANLEKVVYKEGDKIITRGTPGSHLYLITHGTAEVLGRFDGRDVRACELGPGDVMGELEFVSQDSCIADVVATSPVRAQRLSNKDFHRIVGEQGIRLLDEDLSDARYIFYHMQDKISKSDRKRDSY